MDLIHIEVTKMAALVWGVCMGDHRENFLSDHISVKEEDTEL